MRLSDAILLGDSLKKSDPYLFLSPDGSRGCAFGGALLAAGVSVDTFFAQSQYPLAEMPIVQSLWPGITNYELTMISHKYFSVADGAITIEQLADYVRSVEPQDSALRSDAPEEQIAPALANGTGERDFALSSPRD